ncbi:helix-turn-helix transcriptional regulator [Schlegelella sp. S2-27]|uniref:Helix-turn-helix transcriptional regulator n=1 Tax=Caldimonas mangrovi TaxID=2944811 RepID=A0ABT0YUK9_9BURK|nr:helix-turn-helix domain-containing protein [Caldimonas mangrovi]MCM5682432.1 helix-turn-helix transcriptional regulator [Caldimonas mangrovi]
MENPAPASTAAADVFNAACPSRRVLELIANKWALLILPALRDGPLRNHELKRRVGGVSQKMLTQTLRELEDNRLVQRHDHGTAAPHVEYQLTVLGRSLSETLLAVDRWVEAHHEQLQPAARRKWTGR